MIYYLKESQEIIDWKKDHPGYTVSKVKGDKYKNYWIRDNVLKPIYDQFVSGDAKNRYEFTYETMKWLIKKYGKTNKQIADEIKDFTKVSEKEYPVKCQCQERVTCYKCEEISEYNSNLDTDIQFYGYYCDYDWVAFCWLFGKMIDLPKYFPMYCIDLKQMLDVKYKDGYYYMNYIPVDDTYPSIIKSGRIDKVEKHPDYPKQTNEHSAIHDARWNFELYKFLTDTQWI